MTCDCINKVDEHLKAHNTRLSLAFGILPDGDVTTGLVIRTEKIESRKKGPRVVTATFCPFCGTSFKAAPASQENKQ